MATPVNAAIAEAALLMHRCPGLEKFNIDISVVQRRITWGSIFIQKKNLLWSRVYLGSWWSPVLPERNREYWIYEPKRCKYGMTELKRESDIESNLIDTEFKKIIYSSTDWITYSLWTILTSTYQIFQRYSFGERISKKRLVKTKCKLWE